MAHNGLIEAAAAVSAILPTTAIRTACQPLPRSNKKTEAATIAWSPPLVTPRADVLKAFVL